MHDWIQEHKNSALFFSLFAERNSIHERAITKRSLQQYCLSVVLNTCKMHFFFFFFSPKPGRFPSGVATIIMLSITRLVCNMYNLHVV